MSSTDDRIVRMQFDNKSFMKNASDTQKALSDTNKAVDSAGKSKGLLDLNQQMGTVGVTASKMAVVTTTAIATIANKAVNAGLNMAKALTFDPIKSGFLEYEALLNKQNVIMNATGQSAGVVKGYLNELNTYSDKTIYSFGDMTDSITKFVNAGVDLPTSVVSIQGIANAAAFAGASTNEAGRAMYAFSQSMQTGYVMLNDWMQIENANMGTMKFKEELLAAGEAVGTLTKKGNGYITASGKFVSASEGWRDGLKEQWATTEVLNTALGKYADTNTKLGKEAFRSATEVRSFSAFMDTFKESLGSGWAAVFTSLIGNLKQATSFWTGFSNVVGGSVSSFFKFIAVALKTWRQMGGFEKTLTGFKNILAPFAALLGAIGDAWGAAFPSSNKGAGKALYGLSAAFELLTRPLAWLAKGIPVITPLLTLLFSVIGGGVGLVKDVVGWLVNLVKASAELADLDAPDAGGFVGFLQNVAAMAIAAKDAIGDLISKGKSLGSKLSDISLPSFSMPSAPDMSGANKGASSAASAASSAASGMQSAASKLMGIAAKMGAIFGSLWDKIKSFISNVSPEDVVKSFNQAIFATMAYEVIRFTHSLRKGFSSIMGIGDGFKDLMGDVGKSLTGFAQAAKREAMAKMIISVAIALGILAASLWILSKIPVKQLAPAMAALTFLMYRMAATVNKITTAMTEMKGKQTPINAIALSVALVALGVSLVLLAASAKIMDSVSFGGVLKSAGIMFLLMKMMQEMGSMADKSAGKIMAAGAAFIMIGIAMNIMAGAMLLFEKVKWESMGKAGAVLGGLTLAIGALAMIPYEGIAKVGGALLLASIGMLAMANALILFALVKWGSIGKAAVMLTVLALAVAAILIASGGGAGAGIILAMAAAMVALALAALIFNKVDWESIGKVAVVLTILTVAVAAMAAVLTVFLYAIAPVAPVLLILAAGFALLGVGLLAFAAAMTLAVALAAAGTAAFAALATGAAVAIGVFFQVLSQQAPVMRESVLKILQEMIDTVVQAVPMIVQGFKDLWTAIMKELQSGDKKKSFGDMVTEWLDGLSAAARKYIPKLTRLGLDILLGFLRGLKSRAGEFATIGVKILMEFMEGIGRKVNELVDLAVRIVVKFAEGLEKNAFKLANAGIELIATFLHDLASAIRNGSSAIGGGITDVLDAMRDVGVDMVKGLIGGVTSMAEDGVGAIGSLAGDMIQAAKDRFKIFSPSRVFRDIGKFVVHGLTKGVQENAASAIVAVASMITGAIAVADDYVSKYFQKLDQQAIAARAKAQGLAAAAAKAQKSANKTKTKEDDKAANKLSKRAKEAAKAAQKEEKQARDARAAAARKERWEKASNAERAEIRAEQAQSQLAGAKQAEKAAEAARIQAAALRKQAEKAGSAEERKALLKAAKAAEKEAREQAVKANKLIEAARKNSLDAIKYQKLAGEDAAKAYQELYEKEAKADADAEAFEKLSNAEKAELRRKEAAELQARADEHLAKAKELAYTDLEKANALAQQALEEAERARALEAEADQFASQSDQPGSVTGGVIDIYNSDAAAAAYNRYTDMYDAAVAAAAAGPSIEFNQYNTSPESLSDADIYRQTNNQLTFAGEKLAGAAA